MYKILTYIFIITILSCSKAETPTNSSVNVSFDPNYADNFNFTGQDNMKQYSFDIPTDWALQTNTTNLITIKTAFNPNSFIEIQPILQGSGNLQNDLETVYSSIYVNYNVSPGFQQYHQTGKTRQGFNYIMVSKVLSHKTTNQQSEGALMLVQLSNNLLGVIYCYDFTGISSVQDELSFMLFTLSFPNENIGAYDTRNDLLGAWSSVSSSVGLSYGFYKSGEFAWGGASSFSTYIGGGWEKITTNSFSSTGTYKIYSNILERQFSSNGNISKDRMLFYTSYFDGDTPEFHLGIANAIPLNYNTGGIEFDLDK